MCHCRSLIKEKRPPTRLLCVKENVVKLVITEQLAEVPSYATLSYCWGQAPFIKLTLDTLASFLAGVPWDDLPQTFQDAITVTRGM